MLVFFEPKGKKKKNFGILVFLKNRNNDNGKSSKEDCFSKHRLTYNKRKKVV